MKKLALATATIAALALSASSFAKVTDSSPDFSFVEANYVKLDIDVPDLPVTMDADGIELNGSFELNESAFVTLNYSNPELSEEFSGLGMDVYKVGLGARHSLSARSALFGSVSYVRTEIDEVETYNGFGLSAGVKSRISPEIELTGTLSYADVEIEDEIGVDLGVDGVSGVFDLRYFFSNDLAVGVSYRLSEDTDALSVGARYSF